MEPDVEFEPGMNFDPSEPGVFFDPTGGPVGDGMFSAVPAIMGLFFVIVVVVVVVKLVKAGVAFAENSALPEQTVAARVVAKRTQTQEGEGDTPVHTSYYVTFEVVGGERIEVKVHRLEYGQLVEGDQGQLTHQGTWYRRFERKRVIATDGPWEAPGGPSLPPPSTL